MLLLFHPQTILDGALTGGKLPISIYESYYEPGSENADKGLQVDGWAMGRQLQMRFRQLPFEVETGEAEMIAVDFVAKGSGSATVHNSATPPKAKGRAEASAANNDVQLSVADEEGRQHSHHFFQKPQANNLQSSHPLPPSTTPSRCSINASTSSRPILPNYHHRI